MSQLLALSLDCLSSPSIRLKLGDPCKKKAYGRGFAWYNYDELSTTVIKETKYVDDNDSSFNGTMQDFSKFYSSIFIGHIRGAAKRLVQQDTQPFTRSYAGRDWIFVHSGDLDTDYRTQLPLEKNAIFEPIGLTDSEHCFCYLLEKIKTAGARSLSEIGWDNLLFWLIKINQLGTANIMISDGMDTVIYNDEHDFNPLYWLRSTPPHQQTHFNADAFTIDIDNPFDLNHTFILVSNQNIDQQFEAIKPSQLMVLRRGKILWSSTTKNNIIIPKQLDKPEPAPPVTPAPPPVDNLHHDVAETHQLIDFVGISDRQFYSVIHETFYRYENKVNLSDHLFRLHPVCDHIQVVLDYKLLISVTGYGEFYEDVFGNIAAFYEIKNAYNTLYIRSESIVTLSDNPSHKSESLHRRRDIPLAWLPWQRQMMSPYLLPPELPESELNELIEFAMSFVKRNDYDLMEVLNDINQTLYHDFKYVSGSTSLTTTAYQLYITRRGVCQDFTNLFICLARLINVPARYRTGYIYTAADYSNKIQSEASHAWVELYLPSIGWYGFDPTNGCLAGKNHIRVACGRNYVDAAPTSGTIFQGGGQEKLVTQVQVIQLNEQEIKNFA